MSKRFVGSLCIFFFLSAACYNTYHISRDQLSLLQSAEDGQRRTVRTVDEDDVLVEDATRLAVRSKGGRRYPLTPFNFTLTETQLVASDRDTLVSLGELREDAEVQHLSTWRTVGLISLGVAAATGLILGLVFTSGEKSFAE